MQQKQEVEKWRAGGGKRGGGKRAKEMKDYANYMNTKNLDPKAYAEDKRKKMAAMSKKKAETEAADNKAKEMRQKKIEMAEESRRAAGEF